MGTAARFHRHQTRLKIGEPVHKPFARNRLPYNDTFGAVNCVNLHHILGQIYTNASNLFHDFPLR
jgi:hypothetical protein